MSGLMGTMWMALNALEAQQGGMQTTANNVANLNTPGYSREVPIFQEADPFVQGNLVFGGGVDLEGIQSLRDNLLDMQISAETQQQSSAQSYVAAMNQVQTLFPSDTTGIGQQISAFFQSLNNLSTNPSDLTLRQGVLTAAQNMASAFNDTAEQLISVRQQLDGNVEEQVQQVNQITQQIANINAQLSAVSSSAQQYGSFLDQRSELVQQLSGLIDVSQLNDGASLTLTTKQGTALVVDGQSFSLSTALASDGTQHVYSAQGQDITGQISGGQLGGTLQARDQTIPALQNQLDSLAGGLVTALNTAHQQGTDLYGNTGNNLFLPNTGTGAALNMALAFTDPKMIAASSDGSSGSNGNLANISAVANQAVSNGMTPSDAYGNMVFQVGSAVSDGTSEQDASTAMLQQLQQQQSSVSGVSLDEEASNLLLYQRAYEASAQVISTINQMLQTALNMGAGA
ncbi:MAG TPA: flagellar hook-associated protein FlgK [Terriglobales bacterium]|nr:flagellar hook-associated protein FlgK [Terriglobales bacterium]